MKLIGLSFREAFQLQQKLFKEGKHYIVRAEYRGSYYLMPYTSYLEGRPTSVWNTLLGFKK